MTNILSISARSALALLCLTTLGFPQSGSTIAPWGHGVFPIEDIDGDTRSDFLIAQRNPAGCGPGGTECPVQWQVLASTTGIGNLGAWFGTLGVMPNTASTTSSDSAGVAALDANGDGARELVITIDDILFSYSWPLVPGTLNPNDPASPSTFVPDYTLRSGTLGFLGFTGIQPIGDLDDDGHEDAVLQTSGPTATILLKGSPAGLQPVVAWQFAGLLTPYGDLDADGRIELFRRVGTTIEVFRGAPTGFDVSSTWALTVPNLSLATSLGDVNGDGHADILLNVGVHLGSPLGISATPSWVYPGPSSISFPVGDINSDGLADWSFVSNANSNAWCDSGSGEYHPNARLVEVYLGSNAPLSLTPAWTIDRSDVSPTPHLGNFATTVLPCHGDANGDWIGDLVIVDSVAVSCDSVWGQWRVHPGQRQYLTFCFGDGTSAPCPCGSPSSTGQGCPNSINQSGARLSAMGVPSVAYDSFALLGSGMTNTSTVLYFQGTSQANGGAGSVFGDGLRCVAGTVRRLGTSTNVNGASEFPGTGAAISIAGQIPQGGAVTRYYQAWYRDASMSFCTPSRFNLTNGLSVTWLP